MSSKHFILILLILVFPISMANAQTEDKEKQEIKKGSSLRKKLFWTSVSIGSASTISSIYFWSEAEKNYDKYQDSETEDEGDSYKNKTKKDDTITNISIGIAVVSFGTAIYLYLAEKDYIAKQDNLQFFLSSDGNENIAFMVRIEPESLGKFFSNHRILKSW